MQKLILLDIDGTILSSGGAGRVAMDRALLEVFGTSGDPSYRYDGKTDRQIVRELMRHAGYTDTDIDTRTSDVLGRYLSGLQRELAHGSGRIQIYPGIQALIEAIHQRADAILGLLTGNIEAGAHLKLRSVGLDVDRFVVNAFGSDHEARGELPGIAHQRMRNTFGVTLAGRDVIVIGDTPFDITCGQALGARAIAVATGQYSVEELQQYNPFAVFPTLEDTDAVLRVIDA